MRLISKQQKPNGYTEVRLQDLWNPEKVWVITRSPDHKYYWNQLIGGHLFYSKSAKGTAQHIRLAMSLQAWEWRRLWSDDKAVRATQGRCEGTNSNLEALAMVGTERPQEPTRGSLRAG
ncbi:hypothetical protein [Ferrimonas sp. YFM]|uniref:hypothetical protein n=1 Tax=Ferrimonas sp. YFM TaxID=3028878 RepID=UPI002572E977|nr:hypothetical protein [Ferrimonas sp. YFM]BDY05386.1 hypothetical protein F0521_24270 [Ferrimonas sp. YFM]